MARPVSRKSWSETELARMTELLDDGLPIPEVARRLKRTNRSVREKVLRIGYLRQIALQTLPKVAYRLGTTQRIVEHWVQTGILPATRSHWFLRGRASFTWTIDQAQLRAFLEDERYWPLWTTEKIRDLSLKAHARVAREKTARYWTLRQAGPELHYSRRMLQTMCREGRLPAIRLPHRGGYAWYIRQDKLAS